MTVEVGGFTLCCFLPEQIVQEMSWLSLHTSFVKQLGSISGDKHLQTLLPLASPWNSLQENESNVLHDILSSMNNLCFYPKLAKQLGKLL